MLILAYSLFYLFVGLGFGCLMAWISVYTKNTWVYTKDGVVDGDRLAKIIMISPFIWPLMLLFGMWSLMVSFVYGIGDWFDY